MLKKIIAAVFAGALVLGLVACQKEESAVEKVETKFDSAVSPKEENKDAAGSMSNDMAKPATDAAADKSKDMMSAPAADQGQAPAQNAPAQQPANNQ